jgi:uncharacterized protein with NAD-binding domain and iron-sulfur cluster
VKVAVLGGGMGALSAAWQLVSLDRDRYDITVYQRGWRLGGKAASGRNRQPGKGLRIEEHGLHILMGFYDHVFHILRTCYDDLGAASGDSAHGAIGRWRDALTGSDHIHVCDRYRDGHSAIWELQLPAQSQEVPGARPPEDPDIGQWIRNGLAFIYQVVRQTDDQPSGAALPWLERLAHVMGRRESDRARVRSDLLGEATKASIRLALRLLFRRLGDPERRDPTTMARRRQVITAYFVGANLLGILDNGLWSKRDFLRAADRLDGLDYSEWLHQQTGRIGEGWPELAWDSALVRAVYDLIFSRGTGFGAGTALYDTLSMLLNYRGQVYYRMNGGMGDVVFAPMYLWLRRHGVKFRFFSRVRKLAVDAAQAGDQAGPGAIREISIEDQVELGGGEYDPLFEVRGRPCWPSTPLLERLPERERRRIEATGYDFETSEAPFGRLRQLRRGRDFDVAVLGIPVGVFQDERDMVAELAAAHRPFAEMVAGIQTVRTRALQIWTDRETPALGWNGQPAMLGAYERPFASWADMSHVLAHEAWPDPAAVRSVHYFCGVYEGAGPEANGPGAGLVGAEPQEPERTTRREAIDWLEARLPGLLPCWSWERMCAAHGLGQERFAAQYSRANVSASDRYVLATPGTLRFRLAPDQSGFDNLYLAGDWVKTDLNAGCVEAAAMAGVEAAQAIHRRRGDMIPVHTAIAPRSQRALTLPAYVDRDSDWVLRAPVRADNVLTAAFALRADPEALIAMCADQVDRPTAGEVTAQPWPARAGLVVLLCSELPRVESGDEEHGRLGYFHEHDVGFFVPVAVRTRTGQQELGLLPPYLFVDSAVGLTAGREIYGFSKLLASIDMPAPLPGPGVQPTPAVTVRSDVLALPPAGRLERGAVCKLQQATVLEVIPSRRASATVTPDGLLARALSRGIRFGMPMLFLKQFRDAGLPDRACHQSLVSCRTRAALLGAPRRLHGSFVIRLPPHYKPDVAGTLGLPHEFETRLAVQLHHTLFLPPGRQLWP